jgi:hypothetical protein
VIPLVTVSSHRLHHSKPSCPPLDNDHLRHWLCPATILQLCNCLHLVQLVARRASTARWDGFGLETYVTCFAPPRRAHGLSLIRGLLGLGQLSHCYPRGSIYHCVTPLVIRPSIWLGFTYTHLYLAPTAACRHSNL